MTAWFTSRWHTASTAGRVGLAALGVVYFGSGVFLLVLALRRWGRRETLLDTAGSIALAMVGVLWLGAVVTTGIADSASTSSQTTSADGAESVSAAAASTTTTRSSPTTAPAGSFSTTTPPVTGAGHGASTTTLASTTSPPPTTPPAYPSGEELVLDLLLTIDVKLETPSGYSRDLFEHWTDEDGDGCDTRQEVLIRDAGGTAQVDAFGCAVVAGDWYSVYDGVWISDPTLLDIDHVVALKEAWDSGAKEWDADTRRRFANDLSDPRSLIAVTSESNRSKGAADPSNWLPSNSDDRCRYIAAWVTVKVRWELSMDESEYGRIRNLLNSECAGLTTSAGVPARPTTVFTTTTTEPVTSTTEPTPAAGTLKISTIVYDAPGNDVLYNDSEYVVITNTGTVPVDAGGWAILDAVGHQITIPAGYTIAAGSELRVYTGPGDDTATRYFAGLGQAIWNNSGGDTATLYDPTGSVIDTHSYRS